MKSACRSMGRRPHGISTPPPSRTRRRTLRQRARSIDDARYQFRRNIDLVIAKDTRFAGNQVGQIRFELLNLTNTPKFRGVDSNEVNSQSVRPYHAAGRVHADLAAQFPIHVLTTVRVTREQRTYLPPIAFSRLLPFLLTGFSFTGCGPVPEHHDTQTHRRRDRDGHSRPAHRQDPAHRSRARSFACRARLFDLRGDPRPPDRNWPARARRLPEPRSASPMAAAARAIPSTERVRLALRPSACRNARWRRRPAEFEQHFPQ